MGSKFWLLLFSILVAWSEAKRRFKKQVNDNENDLEKHKELVLSIQEVNKTQFFEQDADKGEYQFGYQISPDGNFHHENRAPDGVTYGCYGYVDAYGTPVEYYYISDGWGYRTVVPNAPVEIFYHAHDPNGHQNDVDENQVDENENAENHGHHHEKHEHHEHHGELVPWNQLHFPKQCENKDFKLPPAQVGGAFIPSQPSQSTASERPSGQPFPNLSSKPGITNISFSGKPQPGISKPQQPTFSQTSGQITSGGPQTELSGQTSAGFPGHQTIKPGTSVTQYPLRPSVSGQPSAVTNGAFPERPNAQIPNRPTAIYPGSSVKPDTEEFLNFSKPIPGLPGQSSTEFPDKIISSEPSEPGSPSQLKPGITEQMTLPYQPSKPDTSAIGIQEKPELSGILPTDYPGHISPPATSENSVNEYPQKPQSGLSGELPTVYPEQPFRPNTSASLGKPQPEFPSSISTDRPGQSFQPTGNQPGLPDSFPAEYPGQSSQPSQPTKPGLSGFPGRPPSGTEYPKEPQTGLPGGLSTGYPGPFFRPEISEPPVKPQPEFPNSFPTGFPGQSPQPTQPTQPGFFGRPSRPFGPGTSATGYPQGPQNGFSLSSSEFPVRPTGYPGQLTNQSKPEPPETEIVKEPQPGLPEELPTQYPEQFPNFSPRPTKPSKPTISVMGVPEKPKPEFPEHPEQPIEFYEKPSQSTRPPTAGISATGYSEKPQSSVSSQLPGGLSEQPFLPSGPGFFELPQKPQAGFPGSRPTDHPKQPTPFSEPESSVSTGFPGEPFQPAQPSGPAGSEIVHPQLPQTGPPSGFPSGFSGKPTQSPRPSTSIISYPEKPQTGASELPIGYPTQPSKPGTSGTGYSGKPKPEFPSSVFAGPEQSSFLTESTPPNYSEQPLRPFGPGISETKYPQKPQTEVPSIFPTDYPAHPSKPGTSGAGYSGEPQGGFPSGFPEFPVEPAGYPQQPIKPSAPGSFETGYSQGSQTGFPGELPMGYPSQSTQSPRPGSPQYPDKPLPEIPDSFNTGYLGHASKPSYPAQQTRPPGVGSFETINTQEPGTKVSGQDITNYPGQPTQSSGSESSIPVGFPSQPFQPTQPSGSAGPDAKYPQKPQNEKPNKLPSGFSGQPSPTPRPEISGYPGKPLPGYIPTNYPEQPHPTQSTEYPGKPYETGILETGLPEKPGSGPSNSLPTKFPEQPQSGQSPANGTNIHRPQTSQTTGYPLEPTEIPDKFGTTYSGKPGLGSEIQTSTQYLEQTQRPETVGAGYPQKPLPGFVGTSSPNLSGQSYPSQPSQPNITNSGYLQPPGFGSAGEPSTAYPSIPVTSPKPSGHFSQQPFGPGVSLSSKPVTGTSSSQKPFEMEYPTVGYFPSPSPSSPSHPPFGASFKPIPQGMTTNLETSEVSKYPSQKPTVGGTEESTNAPNFIEDKLPDCGGYQQPPCITTEKNIDSSTFTRPGGSLVSASCVCDPQDVKCIRDCVNEDRQTTQKPFEGFSGVTTFKPGKPEKPPNFFCNCSPFDSECIKKCMETKECDGSQGDCSFSEESPGQPDYPTYPPPACGGLGQEECPYPPAGIKPFPEFTYPTQSPLFTTQSGNSMKTTSEFSLCQNKKDKECKKPTASFEIMSTTEIYKTTRPAYPQSPSFPPVNSKEPEFPTDYNQPFTESELGMSVTVKPSQGYSPVQKPGNGNLLSKPERVPTVPVQPTDSEKIPEEPFQPLGPERPFQSTEKPYYPSKPEYPGKPSLPDQMSQTNYESAQEKPDNSTDSDSMISIKPLEPTDSEKGPEVSGQSYQPTGIGEGGFGKPTVPQEAFKPEGEGAGGFTTETGETQSVDLGPGQEFSHLPERPSGFEQVAPKPGKPGSSFISSSKPVYGFGTTPQTEAPGVITLNPNQKPQVSGVIPSPQVSGVIPSSQFSGGEQTDGFLMPEDIGAAKPQNTSKYPGHTISSTSPIPGCDLYSSHCAPEGAPPIYIIPYPVPIVPSPGNCPCYLVSPKNETSDASSPRPSLPSSTQPPYPEGFLPQGIIGYIPVVFYPYCPGNNTNSEMVQPYFPQAYPVPYPCQQCQNENNPQFTLKSALIPQSIPPRPTRFTSSYLYSPVVNGIPNFVQEAKFVKGNSFRTQRKSRRRTLHKQESREINSFDQVLKQGNIKSQQIIKSPHRSSHFGERIRPMVRY